MSQYLNKDVALFNSQLYKLRISFFMCKVHISVLKTANVIRQNGTLVTLEVGTRLNFLGFYMYRIKLCSPSTFLYVQN